ncbi:FixH family protein [bacterium]|nr:FixH family protein [bacterium]
MKFPRAASALLLALWLLSPASAQQEIADEPAGNYPLRATLSPWPAVPGSAHLVVDVAKATSGTSALPSLTLSALMDMPSTPNMRPIMTRIARQRTGHYEGDLVLSMAGRWRIQLLLATPNGEFRVVSLVQVGKGKAPTGLPKTDDSCGPESLTDPSVQLTSLPNPPQVGENRLRIQLPKEGKWKKVMVGVDMAGMPMSLLPREATSKGDGRYEIDLNLPMSGVWQVRVDLDGRVPPPQLLNVNPAERRPVSQPLLWLTLAAALPLTVGFAVRKKALAPLLTTLALALSTFSAGTVVERYWPPEASMDMNQPLPEMSAPTPVLEAVVQRLPLSVYRKYPARVLAGREKVLAGSGPVWELLDEGVSFKSGQRLGRVGPNWLLAPFDGVVTRRLTEAGQTLTSVGPVLALGCIDRVRVRAQISAVDRFRVRRGQPVEVIDGDTTRRGVITAVSATSQGSEYWAETTLKNLASPVQAMAHDGSLLPLPKPGDDGGRPGTFPIGQNVLMRCRVEQIAPVLCVPNEAIVERSGAKVVMVVSSVAGQRLAYQRQVTTGLVNDTHTEIRNGLREGETVVALAQEQLAEGALVTSASWGVGSYRDLMIPDDAPHAP